MLHKQSPIRQPKSCRLSEYQLWSRSESVLLYSTLTLTHGPRNLGRTAGGTVTGAHYLLCWLLPTRLFPCHRQGIIHRDTKPGNIMLTKSGAKLMDFGLAKLKSEPVSVADALTEMTTDKKLTAEGTILGTFQYMAPEQLEGREADTRTPGTYFTYRLISL